MGEGRRNRHQALQAAVPGDQGQGRVRQPLHQPPHPVRPLHHIQGRPDKGHSGHPERLQRQSQRGDRHGARGALPAKGKAGPQGIAQDEPA